MENLNLYDKAITNCPLFSGMSDEETEKAVTLLCGNVKTYEKGELLHKPWTRLYEFGLVLSGTVQACSDDFDGNRTIMAQVSPGITFGESLCYLKISDSPVYIYASQKTLVLWMSPDNLYSGENDETVLMMQRRFTSLLALRTLSMNDRIQVLSKISLREKLMHYFGQLSANSGNGTFEIMLNREDMAAYIGANRTALSRELSKMKREGIIDYKKDKFYLMEKFSEKH